MTSACPPSLPFRADLARHARDFRGERAELIDHRVDGFLQLEDLAARVDGDLLGEVAVRDGGGDGGDVANLVRQVRGHVIHGVGEIAPRAADALHVRLTAELSFRSDFARDARDFRRERAELIDHDVDRVLQLEDLAAHFDGDLLGEVAGRDGGRDLGDVAHLRR